MRVVEVTALGFLCATLSGNSEAREQQPVGWLGVKTPPAEQRFSRLEQTGLKPAKRQLVRRDKPALRDSATPYRSATNPGRADAQRDTEERRDAVHLRKIGWCWDMPSSPASEGVAQVSGLTALAPSRFAVPRDVEVKEEGFRLVAS